jgi:hypothetical protein
LFSKQTDKQASEIPIVISHWHLKFLLNVSSVSNKVYQGMLMANMHSSQRNQESKLRERHPDLVKVYSSDKQNASRKQPFCL